MSNSASGKYIELDKLKQEMLTCTMCGFCKNVCPVFLDSNWDTGSPRGRMTLAYGLISGELEPDQALIDRIFQCTQCQDCSRRCPSQAKCPEVVIAAREEMVKLGHVSDVQKKLIENVKTTGNIFADTDVEFPVQEGTIPLFIGCQHLSRPNTTRKNIKLLQKLGVTPAVVPEVCCGFPLEIMGFKEEFAAQKQRLTKIFEMTGKDILTFCPSCMAELKNGYGQNAVHVLQVIDERLTTEMITKPLKKTVTYHDPCDLSRGAGITEEPRSVIKKMGANLVEMEHNRDQSRCCGGGGGILTWDEALSERMSVVRIREAMDAGAEMIITSCPTCEQTLKKAARILATETGGKPMPVRHVLDLLNKAMK